MPNPNTSLPESEIVHAPSWPNTLDPSDYQAFLDAFHAEKSSPFTRIDLFSTKWLSRAQIENKLRDLLRWKIKWSKNARNKEVKLLSLINILYAKSIDFLEWGLYRKVPEKFKKNWEDIDAFLSAIEEHTSRNKNGATSLMFCAILKWMLLVADVHENPDVATLDHDMKQVIGKFTNISWIKFQENLVNWENKFVQYELDGLYKWWIEYRPKSESSILLKEAYNRKYDAVDKFKDLLALRVELDPRGWQSWYVHTLKKFKLWLYGEEALVTLVVKWNFLSDESIQELRSQNIIVQKEKKWASSLHYEDAKFKGTEIEITGASGKRKRVIPEIQFVLPNNKNESWFSRHQVYTFKKILSANARFFGWLTLWNFKYLLTHFETWFDARALLEHLLYPQDGEKPFLYILQREWGKIYFTTSDVYEEKVGKKIHTINELYPEYPHPLNSNGASGEKPQVHKTIHDTIEQVATTLWNNMKEKPRKKSNAPPSIF